MVIKKEWRKEMKKHLLLALLVVCFAAFMMTGCELLEEKEEEIDKTKGVISLEGTYWIHDKLRMGYYFKDGEVSTIYLKEMTKDKYSINGDNVKIANESKHFEIYDEILHMDVNGVELDFKKGNETQFYDLMKEEAEKPQPEKDDKDDTSSNVESSELEGTYWLNEELLLGYYFKDGKASFISFGKAGELGYKLEGNKIVFDNSITSDPTTYSISDSVLKLTSGGITLEYKAVTEEKYKSCIS